MDAPEPKMLIAAHTSSEPSRIGAATENVGFDSHQSYAAPSAPTTTQCPVQCRWKKWIGPSPCARLKGLDETRKQLIDVPDHAEIRTLKDRRERVFVDRDDVPRILHASQVLNGTRDAAR